MDKKYLWELLSKINNRYGLGALELCLASNWFNPFATIYLNLRSFPFTQAFKFPVWVYGQPRLHSLNGNMLIEGKVKSGMIKFNKTNLAPNNMGVQSEIINKGKIIFRGECLIRTGNRWLIDDGKILTIGSNVRIGDMINISCFSSVKIGNNTRIAHRSQIYDYNFHYIADLNRRKVYPLGRPIIIGDNCWICNTSSISAGAIIPDNTIVTSNSLVNKDFSAIEKNSIIGGIPAKLIKTGSILINNKKIVSRLNTYFSTETDEPYTLPDSISIDELTNY